MAKDKEKSRARELGHVKYVSKTLCPHGHSERYTSGGQCVTCLARYQRDYKASVRSARRAKNPQVGATIRERITVLEEQLMRAQAQSLAKDKRIEVLEGVVVKIAKRINAMSTPRPSNEDNQPQTVSTVETSYAHVQENNQ